MPDTQAPTGNSGIEITRLTKNSITIKWVKATDNLTSANQIRYEVMIKKHSEPNTKWRVDREAKGIDSHVFTGLQPDTEYQMKIKATDEAGNSKWYPIAEGCSSLVKTLMLNDKEAPTVSSKALQIPYVSPLNAYLKWERAKDNDTPDFLIKYQVWAQNMDSTNARWELKVEKFCIKETSVEGLLPCTNYRFYVNAIDQAGNVLRYPEQGYAQKKTHIFPATVLKDTETTVCSGVYEYSGNAKYAGYVKKNLGNLFDRNHFNLSFEFYPMRSEIHGIQYDTILSIDSAYRTFCFVMKDGRIFVMMHNCSVAYDTGIPYRLQAWNKIKMGYYSDQGMLYIGNKSFKVGKLRGFGDNIIASMNYGNGHAFYGHIRNIEIENIYPA